MDETNDEGARRGRVGVWMSQPDPTIAESFARSGMDWTVLDLQHGTWDVGSAARIIQLLDVLGLEVYARLPIAEVALLPRLLDHGLTGGIIANVRHPDEVVEAIANARYQDEGTRSFGGLRFGLREAPADLHELRPPVYVVIETIGAIEQLDTIAATPGLGGLVLGPNDLSLAMGLLPSTAHESADWRAALDRVLAVCEANGIEAWAWAGDGAEAATYVAKGWHRVSAGTDMSNLQSALARELAIARGEAD